MVTLRDSSVVNLVSHLRPVFKRLLWDCDTCDTKIYISEKREKKRGSVAGSRRYTDFSVTSVTESAKPLPVWPKRVTLESFQKSLFCHNLKKWGGWV